MSSLIKSNNSFVLVQETGVTVYHEQNPPSETKEKALLIANLIIKERHVSPDQTENLISILG